MCYDIKASKEAQLKRAKRHGDEEAIKQIEMELVPMTDLPIHHATGFQHPRLLIYTEEQPHYPELATWGLVPHWVKDRAQRDKFWNNTLNARGETIFEKPAFRDAAREHRCLVYIDGFYEHHHHKGKTYPYYIYHKDASPIILGGLWNAWKDPESGEYGSTFSIVTTEGNRLLTQIHNNPKMQGPRMPLILPEALADQWLQAVDEPTDQKQVEELIQAYPDELLEAHTVRRLRGKAYAGNIPEISNEYHYAELNTLGL